MRLDHYQEAVVDAARSGGENIQTNAVAGSGKSTTAEAAVAACSEMGRSTRVIAFNKPIASAMDARLKRGGYRNASASTIHSLAFGAVARGLGKFETDADRGRNLMREIIGDDYELRHVRNLSARVASLCKVTLTEPTRDNIDALVDHYDLDASDVNGDFEEVYDAVEQALALAKERTSIIDFDDMVWLPVVLDLPIRHFDTVLVDESQDLNAVQREIAIKTGANQIITVGDERQAIYGFAGADVAAMRTLREKLNARLLPLSICYRCPSSHLDRARTIVPQIEARPDAPEGIIRDWSGDPERARREMKDGDLIICRKNSPLASIAMKLVREGKKATIRGRDISSSLISLLDRQMKNAPTLADGFQRLMKWRDREVVKLEKAGKESRIESIMDRVETIFALSDGCSTIEELKARVSSIFNDNPSDGIVLSSVHRAKGLEAERVMIAEYGEMGKSRGKLGGWQAEQELNLKYVALTRSKNELCFI